MLGSILPLYDGVSNNKMKMRLSWDLRRWEIVQCLMNHLSEQSGTDRALTERPLSSPRCRTGSRSPANSSLLCSKWVDRVLGFLSSRPDWDPLPQASACVPSSFDSGGNTLACGRGSRGGFQFRPGDKHCGTLVIYVLCGGDSHEISAFSVPTGDRFGATRSWIWDYSRKKTWGLQLTVIWSTLLNLVWQAIYNQFDSTCKEHWIAVKLTLKVHARMNCS